MEYNLKPVSGIIGRVNQIILNGRDDNKENRVETGGGVQTNSKVL